MNLTEAKIIMRCFKGKKVDQLLRDINGKKYSYWHISRTCNNLVERGCLMQKKLGVVCFYVATDDGKAIAENTITRIESNVSDQQAISQPTATTTKISDYL